MADEKADIRAQVREYYGKTLGGSDDLKTNACCCSAERPPKYVLDVMPLIADEIIERFYGCGSPIPPALTGRLCALEARGADGARHRRRYDSRATRRG